jgi:hypothetical protein
MVERAQVRAVPQWSQGRFYIIKGLRANLIIGPYGYIYV